MIDPNRLLETFLELVRLSSPSGSEAPVAAIVRKRLETLGCPVIQDEAGNLLACTEGEGEVLLFSTHMDTVGPCEHVVPTVRGGVVYSDGSTILGADDKAGIAIVLEVLQVLQEQGLRHHPIDALFTVREETGLQGAKALDKKLLRATMGIGLDGGGDEGMIVASAPSQNSLAASIHGRAAHAGVNPEDGINAIVVAAEAITRMRLGRIDSETTANIGVIGGGLATNIIPELVTLRGEARSHQEDKLEDQTRAMVAALEQSATAHNARAEVQVTRMYSGYSFTEDAPIIKRVSEAMRTVGVEPYLVATGGGSDANILNAAGINTVELSAGMQDVHTTHEHVALRDMVTAAEVVLACVRHAQEL